MRLSRTNLILIGVLVLQIVLTVISILSPASATPALPNAPLIQGFTPGNVTGLTIHDNNKTEITLTKDASGTWVLPNADNYPASADQITTFLGKVKALDTNRLIAQNPSSQIQLHVSDSTYERLVEIKSGDKTDRLYIGTSGGTNANHMRLNDQSQIYLTSGLASTDVQTAPASWINPTYFSVTQDNIVQLSIKNAQGTFNLKKVNGAWTLDGLSKDQKFNAQSVDRYLGQAASVSITAPVSTKEPANFKMNAPTAVITVVTSVQSTPSAATQPAAPRSFGPTSTPTLTPTPTNVETTYTLTVGAKLDSGDYGFKASNSTYYVQVASFTAETFTNLKLTDLLVAATPAATSAATAQAPATATPAATPGTF